MLLFGFVNSSLWTVSLSAFKMRNAIQKATCFTFAVEFRLKIICHIEPKKNACIKTRWKKMQVDRLMKYTVVIDSA